MDQVTSEYSLSQQYGSAQPSETGQVFDPGKFTNPSHLNPLAISFNSFASLENSSISPSHSLPSISRRRDDPAQVQVSF